MTPDELEGVTLLEAVKELIGKFRWLRVLVYIAIVSVVFDLCVSVGFFIAIRRGDDNLRQLAKIANNAVAECHAANDSATKQVELWNGLLLITQPPDPAKIDAFLTLVSDTPEHRTAIATIVSASSTTDEGKAALNGLLADTFPQRDCSASR